ncbi:MAG: polyprenyl synthetase family protein [Elusimicrobia bacterium]|nr:polyprenyl synthetase family protein [Elusimicrobiota bacterium]
MNQRLGRYFERHGRGVEAELRRVLARRGAAAIPFLARPPETQRKAMEYSLFAGGKRLRPVLVAAATEACGRPGAVSRLAACALEMIHTYSLIHDDLPAMDDDDLRRGKPTNHKVFGEAIAILAGDGLLTLAFELAAENAAKAGLGARETAELVRVIAAGAGARGMVAGQVLDLEAENFQRAGLRNGKRAEAAARLRSIHTHKTAALITASLEAGAILGRAGARERAGLREYGRTVGLAFQIADDVLDVVGDKAKLGKRGSDEANAKLTYARVYGVAGARARAAELLARAHGALRGFPPARVALLHDLADYVVARDR